MRLEDLDNLREGHNDACPSGLVLDELVAGELEAARCERVEAHLDDCRACAALVAERRAGFDAVDDVDPRVLLAGIRRRLDEPEPGGIGAWLARWLTGKWVGAALVAGVAALLLVALPQRQEVPTIRAKGGPILHVYRHEGPRSVEMLSGDRFSAGDRIRFVVDLPEGGGGFARVLGVEQDGTIYTAWPLDPAAETELGGGDAQALPGAVELDESGGREPLYLVLCPEEDGPGSCRIGGPGERLTCPVGCSVSRFVLDKGL